nr:uncharacterized protein LOC107396997 [Nothobranchius furzeri]
MSQRGDIENICTSQEKADINEQVEATTKEMQAQVESHKQASETVTSTALDSLSQTKDLPHSACIRKSERKRTLTEKGQALADDRLKDLKAQFNRAYERWKHKINGLKKAIKYNDDSELTEIMSKINTNQVEIDNIYLKIRDTVHPDHPNSEIRRINDTCQSLTKVANKKAQKFLINDGKTRHSKEYSYRSQDARQAAAEAAATEEVLKIMKAQHDCEEEIWRLEQADQVLAAEKEAEEIRQKAENEAENARKRAQFIAESAARKMKVEEKKKEVERLEELKRLNAAKARLKVYSEIVHSDDEEDHLLPPPLPQNPALSQPLSSQERHPQILPANQSVAQQPYQVTVTKSFTPHSPIYTSVSVPQASSFNKPTVNYQSNPIQTVTSNNPNDTTNELVKTLAEAIAANRIPIPEPAVFTGDPLKYTDWKLSFSTLINQKNLPNQEKLFFLRKYVGGAAKRAIEGHFLVGSETAYNAAWNVLEDRFGNPFLIGKAYRDKIHSWHKIGPKETVELREFADFLSSVESAMSYVQGLQVLNDCMENQKIAQKLPDWLSSRWNRAVVTFQDEIGAFPDFKYFVSFLNKEARIACHPVTSWQAMNLKGEKSRSSEQDIRGSPKDKVGAKTFTTNTSERIDKKCLYCKRPHHTLHKCRKFIEKPLDERVKFVREEKLCFGCLENGHHSKVCKSRSTCDTCKKPHPTCLHQNREKREQKQENNPKQTHSTENDKDGSEQDQPRVNNQDKDKSFKPKQTLESDGATSLRIIQERGGTLTSPIVPVYVSSLTQPDKEILVYALLDSQSDTTFILKDVADTLDAKKDPVKLKVSTITSRTKVVSSERLTGLEVRGLKSEVKIKLPVSYTREYIPANRAHIPTSETAMSWPHLEHLAEEMSQELDCEVGLLIGYNCSQALAPREVIHGSENQPFALKSVLGWSIVGYNSTVNDYEDEIGVSHHIIAKQVIPLTMPSSELKSEVHFSARTQVKEVISPSDMIKVFESDFSERKGGEAPISQEDLRFLAILKENIKQKQDGHYQMPLPFKVERPSLPNNRACAEYRLKCLRKRLQRDEKYCKDYVAFMKDMIERGDERVPKTEIDSQTVWYIPHHGVYHPKKPGKIRVVFDCSAQFQNTSLNKHLLTGPDLTNNLTGVLCRFRKGQIAIMCDVERMFHQFHVDPQDQDYLRFLWWEGGKMDDPPSVYRMKVHLFGAASSPGCANFGLKHLATQGDEQFSEQTVKFIQRNFYVDDGLTSVDSEAEAIQLVQEARELCSTGMLHLHKFISNKKVVLDTLPKEECADGATNLDMAFGEPKMERALGVQWSISSDKFQFRVEIKENPFTKRGVLSTVASIFDPLGFLAQRRVQFLSNEFWTRWKREYLLNLQQRRKWTTERRNAKVNDIVLLLDDNLPRNQWKLARIVEVFPAADNRVRKVKLLVSNTFLDNRGKRTSQPLYLERAIHKTVLLLEAE